MNPKVTIIAALSDNRVIGDDLEIPWHLTKDLQRFRALTTGHTIIVGRTTFELIKKAYENRGKPLPDRKTIIITHNHDYQTSEKQCYVVHSMEEAIALANKIEKDEVFISGGASIYALGMPYAERLLLTIVHVTVKGDALFPDYSQFINVIDTEDGEERGIRYTFRTLEP